MSNLLGKSTGGIFPGGNRMSKFLAGGNSSPIPPVGYPSLAIIVKWGKIYTNLEILVKVSLYIEHIQMYLNTVIKLVTY